MPPMKMSGARIVIEVLIEHGVDTVFGYPGGAILELYDELYKCQDRIRHILVSHEQHAAHAADGYARSSGRVGVCFATSGPGATNLVTGIATAAIDSVPLLAVTCNVGMALLGKDSFQEVDIAGVTMPLVKHNWIVRDIGELAEILREAFMVAKSGRPGPVLIDIPKNITTASTDFEAGLPSIYGERAQRLTARSTRKTFTKSDIERAAALIRQARYPVLYAGGGVILSEATLELKDLAERLNAPVALSLMGMGGFPHDHPLCTGLIGMHGTVASNKVVQKADLLLAIGARFSDRVTSNLDNFAPRAKILHIDIDPAEINKNIPTYAFIIGDIKAVLGRLLARLPPKIETAWSSEIETGKHRVPKDTHRKNKLHPRFVIEKTAKRLGPAA
ncbi:thiamine pyrophosphate-binding protein, partial [Breznakiellaceae bacterium SP9]